VAAPSAAAAAAAPADAGAVAAAPVAPPAPGAGLPVDPGIFRAYDIRGVLGKTLDAGVAEMIGRAIGSLMQEQGASDIVVGRDGRLSGPDLVAGLTEGLRKAGRNVIDIGMVPTPVVYFATYHLHTGCGIAVTGSHNPPDYNGFKIMVGGKTLSGEAITDLYQRIAQDRLHLAETRGTHAQRDVSQDYIARIASDVQVDRPIKVVVDAGNGVAGELGPRVLEAIGAQVVPQYCEIDGTFPNHHPDPSEPHNLEDLIARVQAEDAELGIAFDGDGDRLGVVTRDGRNIFPDRLLMLFAADVLERNPGAVIVYDVKCSGRLQQHILRHGGSPLMWRTGHSLIKTKMREVEAELAGEMSGHFFFAERWYGFDDGLYAAARLLEVLTQQAESPTFILNSLPDGVSTPEIKVPAPGEDPHGFVERFRAAASFEGARTSTIDGLRVDWPDGWGLVRASNTTPVLVMRFDAESPEALERIQGEFRRQLLALDPALALPF
jgi:phosphomannomutase/phosphoglucomutase